MELSSAKKGVLKQSKNSSRKSGFTLPEVIISFSVMAMVLSSAVSVLMVVIRANSDNLNSLTANGLAQEGLEAIRFIRDSNSVLGLDFDGSNNKSTVAPVWGTKLYDKNSGKPGFFKLINNEEPGRDCDKVNLSQCLPVTLSALTSDDLEVLAVSDETLIDKSFHRVIRVEPLRLSPAAVDYDGLRVNSIVYWTGINGLSRKVVLTTELTDWR